MVTEVANSKEKCQRCGKGKMVTDNESGEMFCSKCGFVMSEKLQESGPEWRSFTQDEHGDRARAGGPTARACRGSSAAVVARTRRRPRSGAPCPASMKSTI